MTNATGVAQENAVEIRRIVEAHRFSDPRIVEVEDPDYDLTLLLTPVGEPTLLDIGALVVELQDALHVHAFIVTDDEFAAAIERTGQRLETRAL